MKRFRHWFFKVLTGYDIAEYSELLRLTRDTLTNAKEVNDHAAEILRLNEKVLQANQDTLDVAGEACQVCQDAISNCKSILRLCRKEDENEALD